MKLWKDTKKKFLGKFLIPLTFYTDDFEVDNPLGPTKGVYKIGAVYYTIPCLPQKYLYWLSSIFVAYLFNTIDRTNVGYTSVFEHLFSELRDLETSGIIINVDGNERCVYFALSLLIGNYFGVHGALGFVEGFTANYPCRFCKSHRNIVKNDAFLHPNIQRNRINYEEDVKLNNGTLTGIKNECLFNSLTSFHVTENVACDMMHDVLLGVCRYDLPLLIN